jgi:hypothetical protein
MVVQRQATSRLLDSDRRVWGLNWQRNDPITTNEIIGEPNIYFTETPIRIREQLRIELKINNYDFVDVDFNWPNPHYYLGNWQYGRQDNIYSGTSDTEGFLTDELTIIQRYSWATIVADYSQLMSIDANMRIQQCNFELRPKLKIFLPVVTPELTYQANDSNPLFEGLLQRQPPRLKTTAYTAEIFSAVISIRPGVELVRANYTALVVNQATINEPAYELPTCKLPEKADCQKELELYLTQINGGAPPNSPNNNGYTSLAACEASWGAICQEESFRCSTGLIMPYFTPKLE